MSHAIYRQQANVLLYNARELATYNHGTTVILLSLDLGSNPSEHRIPE